MHIRLVQPEDLPAVLEISNWAAINTPANFAIEPESLESWQQSYHDTHEKYPWYVADEDGVIVGFAKASPWKGRCAYAYSCEITVYVHPDHHRRGIGKRLYKHLFPTLVTQGYQSVVAGITLPNEASVVLHENFGLHKVALFERIGWKFGRWHDVGYWQKTLADGEPPKAIRSVAEVTS